ncbi:RAMP superfamily CRISPR-associated protein [Campylobacter sp. 2018MI13]|uniref:RAMP superfamily CRISPR-associated protein n=1 Tax=Campylobacter sp. 2018MI13 TaxID=2836737 RepID=UPI001BDA1172|nr:RAMP superfamily CRISPR-associated protein [Campylobacter sp. 2018MI13]MBT0882911.1 hypothetical protein [Campylobacter sp. 2018MI13]
MILKITLLSNTIITNGNGDALIDLDCDYNEYGLPYISAKRLKGMLKDSANELVSMGQDINVLRLFGDENNEGIIKLSDARLQDYDILEKLSNDFKPDLFKNSFSVVLSQTSLDERGVAKKGSLRRFRAYDKGLIFESEIDENFKQEFQKDLELICLNLRYIGHKRTRGFGKVKCEIIKNKKINEISKKSGDIMVFTLLDDVVLTNLSGDENTIDTKEYLSASAIKGAFKKLGVEYSKPQNAYFYDDKNIFYPAPMNLKKLKYAQENLKIYTEIDEEKEKEELKKNNDFKIEKKSSIGGYVCIKNSILSKAKISTINKTHVSLADKENMSLTELEKYESEGKYKNKIFSYTAISKGQQFAIKLMDEENFSELDGKVLRLGKSANSQYGRVKISFESSSNKESNFNNEFYLVAISPVLLRNEIGGFEPSLDALKNELEKQGLKLEKIVISRYEKAQFYNNSYKCKTPQVMGFSIGSVFKVSGNLNQELVQLKTQDEFGFGWLKAYKSFDNLELKSDKKDNETNQNSKNKLEKPKLSDDELKNIEPTLKNILKKDLEQRVFLSNEYKNYEIQYPECKNRSKDKMTKSELARIEKVLNIIGFDNEKSIIDLFKKEFKPKQNGKQNEFLDKMERNKKGLNLSGIDIEKFKLPNYDKYYDKEYLFYLKIKTLISKLKQARKETK